MSKIINRARTLIARWGLEQEHITPTGPCGFTTVEDVLRVRKQSLLCNATRASSAVVHAHPSWPARSQPPRCKLWPHQLCAIDAVVGPVDERTAVVRSGVVDVGCGGGKTLIGCEVIRRTRARAIVVSIHRTSLHQWQAQLHAMGIESCVAEENHIEWATDDRPIVVLITYSALTRCGIGHHHLYASDEAPLMLLDEVHCASADVFCGACRLAVQAIVGFTGTLVREDNGVPRLLQSLGPVLYQMTAKELVRGGVTAACQHVVHIVPMSAAAAACGDHRPASAYLLDGPKLAHCARLLNRVLTNEHVLVYTDRLTGIGTLVAFLRDATEHVVMGPITGGTPVGERVDIMREFDICHRPCVLVLSKVGNSALDFGTADAAIQLQQRTGSRNEEGQRVGRIVRRKPGITVQMHTLAIEGTSEVEFAARRAQFTCGVHTTWMRADGLDDVVASAVQLWKLAR